MSTRGTRRFERNKATRQGFHLYDECFDDDGNVYLELTGFQFEASTSGTLSGDGGPRLTVKLPLAWAEKLGLIQAQEDGPDQEPETQKEGGHNDESGNR
jgi:hypothetical protein